MEVFGEKPIQRTAVNIHRVLEHVRRLAQSGFAAHVHFQEIYDPSLPPVWGNRDQLVQVVLNLVKNAAEAIADEGTCRSRDRAVHRLPARRAHRRPRHARARRSAAVRRGARQRPGHSGRHPPASVRALRDVTSHRQRAGPGAGRQDRRRPWRADRGRQPSRPHRIPLAPAGRYRRSPEDRPDDRRPPFSSRTTTAPSAPC